MNLKLVLKSEKVKWSGKWIYVGENFLSIEKLKKYYGAKNRISLKEYKKKYLMRY